LPSPRANELFRGVMLFVQSARVLESERKEVDMSLKEMVLRASADNLTTKDGRPIFLQLGSGLTSEEIDNFQERLGVSIPAEIIDLLGITSGIEIKSLGYLDLLGNYEFSFEEAFPMGLPILKDNAGNFWIVDIHPDTGAWRAIYFVCHDPPVIVIQARTLEDFLDQIIQAFKPPHTNLLSYVQDEAVNQIYASSAYFIEPDQARRSPDVLLSTFANSLSNNCKLADLRHAQIGSGFNYGLYGPTTTVKRFGAEPIFAVEGKGGAGLIGRLLQRLSNG
jgi:cell wall assembly regulator SMI1